MATDINVYAALHSATGEGIIARAAQIHDASLNKMQSQINEGVNPIISALVSDGAMAWNNPFVKLGDYDSWEAANAALTALLATHDAECLKYTGRLRFSVQGGNFEAYMFIRNVITPVWVQAVSGAVQANAAGTSLEHGERFATFIRDCNGATISAWEEACASPAQVDAVRATALGTGTEHAYDVPMKVEKVSGIQMNLRLKELILSRRGQQTNGLYRFEHAQGHQALLLMGGNVSSDTPNANSFANQIVIGDVNIVTAADFIYPDEGFENGLSFSAATVRILSRRIKYTGNGTEYTVTQWASKLTLL